MFDVLSIKHCYCEMTQFDYALLSAHDGTVYDSHQFISHQ